MIKVWRTLGIVSGLLIPALLPAATHAWTGTVSSLWSDNANWTGGTPAGDPAADLVFPSSSRLVTTDDIPGVTFVNSILFTGSGYTVSSQPGSSVALAGNISATGSNEIQLPIALYSGVEHIAFKPSSCCSDASLTISGVISGPASDPLTFSSFGGLASNGKLDVTLSGNNTYAGTTMVSAGFLGTVRLFVMGYQPNSAVTGGLSQAAQLSGTGTVGPLSFGLVAPGTGVPGVLHSVGNGQFGQYSILRVRLNGTSPGTQYDQLSIVGAMQLTGVWLDVLLGFTPAVGDSFTVLQATGGLSGTFNYAEGEVFSVNCLNFQIHYTSNSVVLTRVAGGGPPLEDVSIATGGSRTVCTNGTGGTVTANDAGGCANTHQWGFRTVSGGAITPIPGETGTTYTIDGSDFPGTGTFYLVETTTPGFGSPVTSNELTVTVVPPPTAVASGSATVCTGSGALLSGSGASSCSWAPAAGLSNASSCTPLAAPDSTTTYSLTVMGASGCTSTNTAEVTVTVDPGCTAEIGPLSFYTVPPCRIADTRDPAGTYGGPALSANTDRVFPLVGQCGIPEGARAVALNITVTNPTSGGHLTLHPAGTPLPIASTINFRANQTRANNAAARLSLSGNLAVFCGMASGSVDLILDVNGYYQ
jgi:hypothetical protein